ncbi:MAG: isoleucine--tRNA ligase [Candidatus Methanomethyliaceae archaeon]|nr:isoleucine--tRNA ligase [Candidatus Methanomethyliaceae archaeon]MDW7970441.1 isoleucine--tRNA ligase [Nitrososphaerota archaeon]
MIGLLPKEYNAKKIEEEIHYFWERNRIYEESKVKRGDKFYFLDGPPYVTNPIHVGTAWNKILKDVYIRYFKMRGYEVRDQPGFDMHGLPIEVMVEKKLGIKSKKEIEEMGIDNFVNACKQFALENLKIATKQFKNLGIWMEWDKPYRTIDNSYIESVWWLIKRAYEKGLLAQGKKIVHWCPRCETVLAGYEVTEEYKEIEEDSIYVKFRIEGRENEYIVIWTTTPWTLPANLAVMVNPNFIYAKVKIENEYYIMAEERVPYVLNGLKYEIIEKIPGSALEWLKYIPPLIDEVPEQKKFSAHFVVLSETYVTLEEGTGCVHVAPGHGEEDFEIGRIYGLPEFCPVDERGRFTIEGGKYFGKTVREANEEIIRDLERKGLLLKKERMKHRYPHCWRCKTPLILRLANQWFIKVTSIKEKMLEENEKVIWVPEWAGKSRFGNWIKNAKDWVISRQRYWGIPLPIWICEKCGEYEVIGSIFELKNKADFIPNDIDLHRPWVDNINIRCECGNKMKRVSDVVDVWMDSGAASFASLNYPLIKEEWEKWWPVDLVLEGHDQTRGWFYTLMICSIIAFDSAPYKRVLMHGFTVDQEGRAMHKSLGNVIYPEEVIEKYGRDALRWYELGCTTWEDLRFTWKSIEDVSRFINILWNTYYFASLYMNLDKFSPENYTFEIFRDEDKWILSKFTHLVKKVTESMENLCVFDAVRELEHFMKEELSRWYIKIIRRRIWKEMEDPDKTSAYLTMYEVLFNFLKMIAPIMPFISEKIYQEVFRKLPKMPISVHLLDWPKIDDKMRDEELEEDMEIVKEIVEKSYGIRQSSKIKIRQPLRKLIVVSNDEKVIRAISRLKSIILDQANVKDVEIVLPEEEKIRAYSLVPNFSVIGPMYRERSKDIAKLITNMNAEEVMKALKEGLPIIVEFEGEKIELKKDYFIIKQVLPENYREENFSLGTIYMDITKDEELIVEGLMRDIIRRVQEMRKRADLKVDAYIKVWISTYSEEIKNVINRKKAEISAEVRAREIIMERGGRYIEDWEIEGEIITIGIEEVD